MMLLKELLDYGRFVYTSDQDTAIWLLKETVIRRIMAIKGDGIQIVPEVSPVGQSQSNGEIEDAIKQVQR